MERVIKTLRHCKDAFVESADVTASIVAIFLSVAAAVPVTLGAMTVRGELQVPAVLIGVGSQLGLYLIESVYAKTSADHWRIRKYRKGRMVIAFVLFFFVAVYFSSVYSYKVLGSTFRAQENAARTLRDWERWVDEADAFAQACDVLLLDLRGNLEKQVRENEDASLKVTGPEREILRKQRQQIDRTIREINELHGRIPAIALDVERPAKAEDATRQRNNSRKASRILARDLRFRLKVDKVPAPPSFAESELVPEDPQHLLIYQLRPAQLSKDPTAAVVVLFSMLVELLAPGVLFWLVPRRSTPTRVSHIKEWLQDIQSEIKPGIEVILAFRTEPDGDNGEAYLAVGSREFTLEDARDSLLAALPKLASRTVRNFRNATGIAIDPASPLLQQLGTGPLVIEI